MSRSDVLVDADWVEARIGVPGTVIVEVDEDTSAYEKGHIPSAIRIDWKKDLQDPVRRDFIDKIGFAVGLPVLGIVFAAFALAAAFLNAAFDFCLGCHMYLFIQRIRPAA